MPRILRCATSFAALFFALFTAPAIAGAQARGSVLMEPKVGSRADLHDALRRLFIEHAAWTRAYIVAVTAGLPDKDATSARLAQNQTDIGAEFALYYGNDDGGKLAGLLKEHIMTLGEVLGAMKSGNTVQTDSASRKWRANADETSDFLHKLNPGQWESAHMRTMMYMHCDQTLAEMRDRLKKDYAAEIVDSDNIEKYAIVIADMLSGGIVAQFPEKFGIPKKGS